MSTSILRSIWLTVGTAAVVAACADSDPLEPESFVNGGLAPASVAAPAQQNMAIAQMRRATARYHDVAAALADGYVPVGECEAHEGEAPGGIPYAHFGYLLDGRIDPARPDALLYEPDARGGLSLVGVELAVPYPLWPSADAPQFMGETFRAEDDMGVWGLHIWVWRHNPDGMFAWGNPQVSCGNGDHDEHE